MHPDRLVADIRRALPSLLALSRRGGQTVLMDCLLFRPFDPRHIPHSDNKNPAEKSAGFICGLRAQTEQKGCRLRPYECGDEGAYRGSM